MGLGSVNFEEAEKRGKSKDSSSSSSSSSSGFPRTQKRCPRVVLIMDDNEHELIKYPETEPLTWEQTWHSQPWKLAEEPPLTWDRVWWSEDKYKLDKLKVKEVIGADLEEALKNNPDRAKQILSDARAGYESESQAHKASQIRKCGVCSEDIHLLYDSYEEVNNKAVCSEHTIEELAAADLI